jgi:D-alanyl-D-alanine carboxypeptidase
MTATTFRNASGLPDDAQVTTARDMVTLALRLQDDFPKHYPLFATRTATYKDETFHNHNTLLFHYEGTDGLKTGYTRASGFNLVASVRRGKKHVIGVVFGGASAASRNSAMRTYLNMGLVKASNEKTRQPAAPLIAQAPRPTAGQKIAAVPMPKRVPRPPEKAVVPAATPPTATPPAEPTATQLPPAQPSAPAVEIARVRPVLVARVGRSWHQRAPGSASRRQRTHVADAALDHGREPGACNAPRRSGGKAGTVLGYHHRSWSPALDLRAAGLQAGARRATGDDRGAASPGARRHQGAGGCATPSDDSA